MMLERVPWPKRIPGGKRRGHGQERRSEIRKMIRK